MPNRSSGSRCSPAARPCATEMGKSSRRQHFRRGRTRRCREGCSLIGGGSVRLSLVIIIITSSDVFDDFFMVGTFLFFYLFIYFVGNTRVISQTALDHFRTSLQTKQHDPYSVLLRRNKLPMQLLDDAANPNLRKVRIGWPQCILDLLIKPSAAFSYRRDGTIRRYFRSQGSTEAPAHRCWHVRGPR